MYKSTDRLVSDDPGTSKPGYQTVEGGGTPGNDSKVPDVPQTFLSQVKKAREENIGCCNFCMAFFALLLGSILWTIVLVVIITVPIVMIVIGAEYFNECRIQKMIPISLIVAGCVFMLSNVINFVDRFRRFTDSSMPQKQTVVGWINVFLNLFLAAWFVAMCYWVYSVSPDFNLTKDNAQKYCNPHLYGFVYWFLNCIFIFFGTMVVVCGLIVGIALCIW